MTDRTLLLLRHAKSSWDDPALADLDRPLAPARRDGRAGDGSRDGAARLATRAGAGVAVAADPRDLGAGRAHLANHRRKFFPNGSTWPARTISCRWCARRQPLSKPCSSSATIPGSRTFAALLAGDGSAPRRWTGADQVRPAPDAFACAAYWRDCSPGSARLTHSWRA